jgi:hypothetical protein
LLLCGVKLGGERALQTLELLQLPSVCRTKVRTGSFLRLYARRLLLLLFHLPPELVELRLHLHQPVRDLEFGVWGFRV